MDVAVGATLSNCDGVHPEGLAHTRSVVYVWRSTSYSFSWGAGPGTQPLGGHSATHSPLFKNVPDKHCVHTPAPGTPRSSVHEMQPTEHWHGPYTDDPREHTCVHIDRSVHTASLEYVAGVVSYPCTAVQLATDEQRRSVVYVGAADSYRRLDVLQGGAQPWHAVSAVTVQGAVTN